LHIGEHMQHKELVKHIKKSLELTQSKEEYRPHLCGVYFCPDKEAAVSTNGYALTFSRTLYDRNLSGKIINFKEMKSIEREYLKYQPVMPSPARCKKATVTIGTQYAQKLKRGNMPVYFYLGADDTLEVSYDRREGALFSINAPLMFPVAIGHTFHVLYSGELNPVMFGFDEEFNNAVVIMPLKMGA